MAMRSPVKQASDSYVKQEPGGLSSDAVFPDTFTSGPAVFTPAAAGPIAPPIAAPPEAHVLSSLQALAAAGCVPCCSDPDAPGEPGPAAQGPPDALQQAFGQQVQAQAHGQQVQAQALGQQGQAAVLAGLDDERLQLTAITRLGITTVQDLQAGHVKVLEIAPEPVAQLDLLPAIFKVKACCQHEEGQGLQLDWQRCLPDPTSHLNPHGPPTICTPSYSERAHILVKFHSLQYAREQVVGFLQHNSQLNAAQQANARFKCSAAAGQCMYCSVHPLWWQWLTSKGKCVHKEAQKLEQAMQRQQGESYQPPWASHASSLLGSTYVFHTNLTCLRNPVDANDAQPDINQMHSLLAADEILKLMFPDVKAPRLSEREHHMVHAFSRADPTGPWKVLKRYAGYAPAALGVQTRAMAAKAAASATLYQYSGCGSNTATPASSSSGNRGSGRTRSTAVGKGVSAQCLKGLKKVMKGPAVKGGDLNAMKESRRMLAALVKSVELYLPEAVWRCSQPARAHAPDSGPLPTPKKHKPTAARKRKGKKPRGRAAKKQLFPSHSVGDDSQQRCPPCSPTASTAHHG